MQTSFKERRQQQHLHCLLYLWTSTDNCKQYMAVEQYTAVVCMHDGQAHPYICMQQLTYIYILILYIVSTYHRYYANVMTSCMQFAYFMSCIIMFIYECTCTHACKSAHTHSNMHIPSHACIILLFTHSFMTRTYFSHTFAHRNTSSSPLGIHMHAHTHTERETHSHTELIAPFSSLNIGQLSTEAYNILHSYYSTAYKCIEISDCVLM